jgi:GNAT superfamily N-acetyltransferase
MSLRIVDITDDTGRVVEPAWLAKAERVHRELRPHLPAEYEDKMKRVFAGGARMSIAVSGDDVTGVAVHRIYENTFDGVFMYVDDLVTDSTLRSRGVGRALLLHMQAIARTAGCQRFTLDSGVQRAQAHKFYFREGMTVTSFHFGMSLDERPG